MSDEIKISSTRELDNWLDVISELLDDFLPPTNNQWSKLMRDCFDVAQLAPDHPNIFRMSARIFYKITKNHYLIDGNKRSAVICIYLFLFKNNFSLAIEPDELYHLAKSVADSKQLSEELEDMLETIFKISIMTK
jgi:death-on-curing family protein